MKPRLIDPCLRRAPEARLPFSHTAGRGSPGGHLAALTALSANEPRFQPGFEHVDTSVIAAVPFYGVYDLLDRARIRGSASMTPFLSKQVFKATPDENPALWDAMSPITRVNESAPPFLVIQGTHDTLVFVEEAREFVRALREKSRASVAYLEMTGAQHAFDMFHSPRSAHAVRAAAAFLQQVRRKTDSLRAPHLLRRSRTTAEMDGVCAGHAEEPSLALVMRRPWRMTVRRRQRPSPPRSRLHRFAGTSCRHVCPAVDRSASLADRAACVTKRCARSTVVVQDRCDGP